MDFDYHNAFQRLCKAYKDVEKEACEALMASGDVLVEQSKSLKQENDLKYFMSEYSGPFYLPSTTFQFTAFDGDDVSRLAIEYTPAYLVQGGQINVHICPTVHPTIPWDHGIAWGVHLSLLLIQK